MLDIFVSWFRPHSKEIKKKWPTFTKKGRRIRFWTSYDAQLLYWGRFAGDWDDFIYRYITCAGGNLHRSASSANPSNQQHFIDIQTTTENGRTTTGSCALVQWFKRSIWNGRRLSNSTLHLRHLATNSAQLDSIQETTSISDELTISYSLWMKSIYGICVRKSRPDSLNIWNEEWKTITKRSKIIS